MFDNEGGILSLSFKNEDSAYKVSLWTVVNYFSLKWTYNYCYQLLHFAIVGRIFKCKYWKFGFADKLDH